MKSGQFRTNFKILYRISHKEINDYIADITGNDNKVSTEITLIVTLIDTHTNTIVTVSNIPYMVCTNVIINLYGISLYFIITSHHPHDQLLN